MASVFLYYVLPLAFYKSSNAITFLNDRDSDLLATLPAALSPRDLFARQLFVPSNCYTGVACGPEYPPCCDSYGQCCGSNCCSPYAICYNSPTGLTCCDAQSIGDGTCGTSDVGIHRP